MSDAYHQAALNPAVIMIHVLTCATVDGAAPVLKAASQATL